MTVEKDSEPAVTVISDSADFNAQSDDTDEMMLSDIQKEDENTEPFSEAEEKKC